MAITIDAELRQLSQDDFGAIAYEVMRHAFDIHRELGRFFDEGIYQAELAYRCGKARIEVPIEVSFDVFKKIYFVDLLVGNGAIFEVKTSDTLHERHRAQLVNYLLLTDLAHGKLINFRPESMEHEFVNTTLTRRDRALFQVDDREWESCGPNAERLKRYLIAMLRDVGTGLDLELYEEAVIHFLGGPDVALQSVPVAIGERRLGKEKLACTADRMGVKITALKNQHLEAFEDHHRRFLTHTDLVGLHWININRSAATFRTLWRHQAKNV
jgi:GxxExxY protein